MPWRVGHWREAYNRLGYMKILKTFIVGVSVCLLTASTASAEVQLTIQNGRVSLVARDATVRQILTEWARVGQIKIINLDKLTGAPMSIELHDVSESQALDIVLRAFAGYLAAPRPVAMANLSVFDRVVVMPQAAAPRAVATAAPAPPTFPQQPQFNRQQPADDDEDRANPNGGPPPNRSAVFNTFPQPQVINPQNGTGFVQPTAQPPVAPAPSAFPTAPYGGVAVPGMVAPAPQIQQGLPGQVPGQVPGQIPGQVPGQIPGQVPGQVPAQVPGIRPGGQ